MKRTSILILALLAVFSCKEAEDTRYFAPEIAFSADTFSASAQDGVAQVVLNLSRPATMDFSAGLVFEGNLTEGTQFTVASHSIDVKAGEDKAVFQITLVDDEIWVEDSWIGLSLMPGKLYTVNPSANVSARVEVSKTITLPKLSLSLVSGDLEMNPYRPSPLTVKLSATKAFDADKEVSLSLGDIEYQVNDVASGKVTLPAGAISANFTLAVKQFDQSGFDSTVDVAPVMEKGVFVVDPNGVLPLHLSDPVPDFSPLLKTEAQIGDGYQLRQAIKTPAGEWDGNLAANVDVSSKGSAYIKSLKNMGTTYGYLSNEVGLHILRLCDFFPNLRGTEGEAILDYGRNNNTRGFSPVDSLFRFVLDKGSETEGDIVLNSPRKFTAFTGDYVQWKDVMENDSKATNGNIFASASPVITGRIDVVLERMEGRFDLADASETMLFAAWFSCDSPEFMNGVDFEKIGAVKDGDLWKVEYKLWAR